MYTLKFSSSGRVVASVASKIPTEDIILSEYELCEREIGTWTELVKEYMEWYINNHASVEYEILENVDVDTSGNTSQLKYTLHESMWQSNIVSFQIDVVYSDE